MAFPVVGVVAPELAISHLSEQASRLGVIIKARTDAMNAEQLQEFAEGCNTICIEPNLVSIGAIKVAEQSGVQIYPSSKLLNAISKIQLSDRVNEKLVITAARSAQ